MTTFAEEYRTLREGCGLADRSSAGLLELTGKDRQRFLNAYVTCEVKDLTAGQSIYGFFTNPQGRILSDVAVLALEDRFWLEVGPGQEEAIASHLQKYILADRVEVRPLAGVRLLTLIGPRAEEVLPHGGDVKIQPDGRFGAPAWTLWTPAAEAESLAERLIENGARPVGTEALEVLRTEAGIPRFGQDFGPDNFPQETGEEGAVSYTKGCYLGQEVVARIHYRGGVQKTLRGLVFEPGTAPGPGVQLLYEGRQAGVATTVVQSITLGRPVGLGILHKRAAEPGTRLQMEAIEQVGEVEVRELPLVP
ncbi:MAG TPA: glycine cleavage T C-terminal barrel domain-containing protein [Thermoanaerobaculia bacterium]|nr:glycine cleavage T C-terminal barrel domain-containing protein [Thermoanaerobaculia bacterium]